MASLTLLQIIITVVAVFAGSTVLSTIGFGIGMVAIPILLLALDPQTAVVVLNAVTIPLLALIVWRSRDHVRFRETLPIGITGLVGALVGAYILSTTDDRILRISVVVLIIALTAVSAFNVPKAGWPVPWPHLVGPLIGFVVGVMLSALAIGGPLLVLFILTRDWGRFEVRASLPLYFMFIMPTATVGYIVAGLFTPERVFLSGIAVGPVLLGFWLGSMVAQRLSERVFRRAAIAVIIVTSVVVLVRELLRL